MGAVNDPGYRTNARLSCVSAFVSRLLAANEVFSSHFQTPVWECLLVHRLLLFLRVCARGGSAQDFAAHVSFPQSAQSREKSARGPSQLRRSDRHSPPNFSR